MIDKEMQRSLGYVVAVMRDKQEQARLSGTKPERGTLSDDFVAEVEECISSARDPREVVDALLETSLIV